MQTETGEHDDQILCKRKAPTPPPSHPPKERKGKERKGKTKDQQKTIKSEAL
jgi:hypothetical protein